MHQNELIAGKIIHSLIACAEHLRSVYVCVISFLTMMFYGFYESILRLAYFYVSLSDQPIMRLETRIETKHFVVIFCIRHTNEQMAFFRNLIHIHID